MEMRNSDCMVSLSLFFISVLILLKSRNASSILSGGMYCVPTEKEKGACVICLCRADGVFYCQEYTCEQPKEPDNPVSVSHQQCTPGTLYILDSIGCTCMLSGKWLDETCDQRLGTLQSDLVKNLSMLTSKHYTAACEDGTVSIVGCNFCICRDNGTLGDAMCTARSCTTGLMRSENKCQAGDLMARRDGNYCELCRCNNDQRLDNEICMRVNCGDQVEHITETQKQSMQTLTSTHLVRRGLADESNESWLQRCTDGQSYFLDCNRCFCRRGRLMCTLMLCIDNEEAESLERRFLSEVQKENTIRRMQEARRRVFWKKPYLRNAKDRPESGFLRLPADNSPCVPAMTYRVDCNTCMCISSGQLACTRMFCGNLNKDHS